MMPGLVLILPLLSFVLSFLISERYSWLSGILASILMLMCAVTGLILFFSEGEVRIESTWFQIGMLQIDFTLFLDGTSRLLVLIVTVISFLIHIYSIGYMAGDSGVRRYFAMLGFFTFSMLGIVLSNNLILTFMFWELMGFSSYMLIGHWMQKPSAAKAAQKAFLFNRIGDAMFLIGILIMLTHPLGSWITIAQLCVFAGIVGKSAQLPLSSWLPDAMEGPTPVSALLHAATMVAAGIFLLIRLSPILTETSLMVIAFTGGITALFGAVCALNQFDIKKILAYSTISQLGLMVTAIGIGAQDAALLHLFTHAFFKAGLFLAAGSVIHALSHSQFHAENNFDVQDIRNLGGLRKKMPVTFLIFCVAGASLAGIPFLSGFISKDAILTSAWSLDDSPVKWTVIALISIVSFCTVLYTYRVIRFVFLGAESKATTSEVPWVMRVPMIILALASCWFVISFNPFSINGWFANSFSGAQINSAATMLSVVTILLALIVARFVYSQNSSPQSIQIIQNAFGIDRFYQNTIGIFFLKLSSVTDRADRKWIDGIIHLAAYSHVVLAHGVAWFDRYIVDGIVNAGGWLTKKTGALTRSFQGGNIQLYIFWAAAGLIIFLFFALI